MTEHMSTALQLSPLIERVHGAHHPELTRVRELTQQLGGTSDDREKEEVFRELRIVTNSYTLPEDACEAYTATYNALESAEKVLLARLRG